MRGDEYSEKWLAISHMIATMYRLGFNMLTNLPQEGLKLSQYVDEWGYDEE